MNTDMTGVEAKVAERKTEMGEMIRSEMGAKVARVEAKVAGVEAKVGEMETRMGS